MKLSKTELMDSVGHLIIRNPTMKSHVINASSLLLASACLLFSSVSKAAVMTNADITQLNDHVSKGLIKPIGATKSSANIYLNGDVLTMVTAMTLYPGGKVLRYEIEQGMKQQCPGLTPIINHYQNVKRVDLKVKVTVDGDTHHFSHQCY